MPNVLEARNSDNEEKSSWTCLLQHNDYLTLTVKERNWCLLILISVWWNRRVLRMPAFSYDLHCFYNCFNLTKQTVSAFSITQIVQVRHLPSCCSGSAGASVVAHGVALPLYRDCFLDLRLFNSPDLRRLVLCYCCQAWTLETVLGGNTALTRWWTARSIDADAKR